MMIKAWEKNKEHREEWVLLMSSKRSNKPSLTFEKRTRGMNETLRKAVWGVGTAGTKVLW